MAKPLQPHAPFCTCAECIHSALHPSVPQSPAAIPDEEKPHWANDERERFAREIGGDIDEAMVIDVDGEPVKVKPVK